MTSTRTYTSHLRGQQTGAKSPWTGFRRFSPLFASFAFVFCWFSKGAHRFSPTSLFAPGFFALACRGSRN